MILYIILFYIMKIEGIELNTDTVYKDANICRGIIGSNYRIKIRHFPSTTKINTSSKDRAVGSRN